MNSRSLPLLAWIAIQILTLSIGAMRLPLWARSGVEPQHFAFAEMVVVQFIAATMLFPILTSDGVCIPVAIIALPFLQLAAFLTATSVGPLAIASVGFVTWFCGLAVWNQALRSNQSRLIAVAALNCILVGAPILSYLIREFSDFSGNAGWRLLPVFDPLTSLLKQTPGDSISAVSLCAPTALFISGALAMAWRKM